MDDLKKVVCIYQCENAIFKCNFEMKRIYYFLKTSNYKNCGRE